MSQFKILFALRWYNLEGKQFFPFDNKARQAARLPLLIDTPHSCLYAICFSFTLYFVYSPAGWICLNPELLLCPVGPYAKRPFFHPRWSMGKQRARVNFLGPVVRSLVSVNRWLRGIKTYRFPWYLTLVSVNHASSNPGLVAKDINSIRLQCGLDGLLQLEEERRSLLRRPKRTHLPFCR